MSTFTKRVALGNVLQGVHVTETKFQGVSSLNQLAAFGLSRPSVLEHALVKDMKKDHKLANAVSVRELIQRRFDRARLDRARLYARYIEAVETQGRWGGTPPITLWIAKSLEVNEGELILPYGSSIVAVDGETQTEARFLLKDDPEFNQPASGDIPIAVVVYHDVPDGYARQILHDLNRYAHPVSEKQLAAQNSEGPLTKAVADIVKAAEIPLELVARYSNTPTKKQLVSHNQLAFSTIGYTMKESALERDGNRFLMLMNNATTSPSINGDTVEKLSAMTRVAVQSLDARKASPMVWQVAGVVTHQGRDPHSLNWSAAGLASKGRTGLKTKLHNIADSF